MSSLLDRIAARQCAVENCNEDRARDTDCCDRHQTDKWMHRLDRNPDGMYSLRRTFTAREMDRRAA
jgi:hypothetical protein